MSGQQAPNGAEQPAKPPNLVDEQLFQLLLNLEIQKAIRLQYCLAVVLVAIEAENSHEHEDYPGLVTHLAEIATRQLRATDVVATLAPSQIGLLLIDAETSALPRIVSRAAQHWGSGRLSLAGREWRVRWSAGAGCYPQTATTLKGLLRQATELMTRAKEEGGGRLYLPA